MGSTTSGCCFDSSACVDPEPGCCASDSSRSSLTGVSPARCSASSKQLRSWPGFTQGWEQMSEAVARRDASTVSMERIRLEAAAERRESFLYVCTI